MQKLTEYTFKGLPNQYVDVVGVDGYGFRFDNKGVLVVTSLNPFIERLKRKFGYTQKEYKTVETKPPIKKAVT